MRHLLTCLLLLAALAGARAQISTSPNLTPSAAGAIEAEGNNYYLRSGNRNGAGLTNLYLWSSLDGENWSPLGKGGTAFKSEVGSRKMIAPSVMEYNGTFYCVYQLAEAGNAKFGLLSSPDLITWTTNADVTVNEEADLIQPQWFVEGGRVAIVYGRAALPLANITFATDSTLTTWTTGTNLYTSVSSAIQSPSLARFNNHYALAYYDDDLVEIYVVTNALLQTSGFAQSAAASVAGIPHFVRMTGTRGRIYGLASYTENTVSWTSNGAAAVTTKLDRFAEDTTRTGAAVNCRGLPLVSVRSKLKLLEAQQTLSVQPPQAGVIYVNAGDDLTNKFASLTNNTTLIIGPGTYDITPVINGNATSPFTSPLRLIGKTNVTVQGSGNGTVIRGAGQGVFMAIESSTNITVQDIMFENNLPGVTGQGLYATIEMRGTNYNVNFDGLSLYNYGNHGISDLWGTRDCSRVSIRNCLFYGGGDGSPADGAAISGIGNGWLVAHCHLDKCLRGIEVEGTVAGATKELNNIVIVNNLLTDIGEYGVMLWDSAGYGSITLNNVLVSGNTFSNVNVQGYAPGATMAISAFGGRNIDINHNLISGYTNGGGAYGIYFGGASGTRNVQIKDNVINHLHGYAGIAVFDRWFPDITITIAGQTTNFCNLILNPTSGSWIRYGTNGVIPQVTTAGRNVTNSWTVAATAAASKTNLYYHISTNAFPGYILQDVSATAFRLLGDNGTAVALHPFTNSAWATSNIVYRTGAATNMQITGNTLSDLNVAIAGIYLTGYESLVANNTLINCGNSGLPGILISTNSNNIRLSGNRVYDTRNAKLTSYGLEIKAGATNIWYYDNDFSGNLTGTVLNSSTNGMNRGAALLASGVATVLLGNNGLPANAFISLMASNQVGLDAATGSLTVSNRTAHAFTIRSSVLTDARHVFWKIEQGAP